MTKVAVLITLSVALIGLGACADFIGKGKAPPPPPLAPVIVKG